jgi:hypothetical protein
MTAPNRPCRAAHAGAAPLLPLAVMLACAGLAFAAPAHAATAPKHPAHPHGTAAPAAASTPAARAPAATASPWPAAAPPDTLPRPELGAYQALLDSFVTIGSKPGEPLETCFDYWELNHRDDMAERLARVRLSLLAVPPSRMSPRSRLAWAINTYNFLVIDLATQNLFQRKTKSYFEGKPAWMRPLRRSVQEMRPSDEPFFEVTTVTVEGVDYSLNAFEKHFVFYDYDRSTKATPPRTLDPRVHFALVCGAKGCPPLQPRAYVPDSLDRQLEAVTRGALENPHHLKFDPETGSLAVSTIFDWYQADFGGPAGAFAFIKRYAPPAVRAEILRRKLRFVNAYIPWDWAINQTPADGS